jgi:hypothetical protein
LSVGFRVRTLPLRSLGVLSNNREMTTTTVGKTVYDWNYNTTSRAPMLGFGPEFEVRLSHRISVMVELVYQRIAYDSVTDTWWGGTVDPTTGTDTRSHMTTAEHTTARYWDLPLILRRRGLRSTGTLSRVMLLGGATGRTINKIRTTNNITYTDSSQAVNYVATNPGRRIVAGGVAGLGFRVIDDFRVKTTPEVRYTRWFDSTFANNSTLSARNQLEIGISFTR